MKNWWWKFKMIMGMLKVNNNLSVLDIQKKLIDKEVNVSTSAIRRALKMRKYTYNIRDHHWIKYSYFQYGFSINICSIQENIWSSWILREKYEDCSWWFQCCLWRKCNWALSQRSSIDLFLNSFSKYQQRSWLNLPRSSLKMRNPIHNWSEIHQSSNYELLCRYSF